MEDRPELHGPAALEEWDGRLAGADDALAEDQLEFWTNICLCHSLIVEPNPAGGLPVYQVRGGQLRHCIGLLRLAVDPMSDNEANSHLLCERRTQLVA